MKQVGNRINLDCPIPRPRHVCLVTETYPPEVNGVAFTLARLAEGLRKQGYIVSLVRPRQRKFDDAGARANSKGVLARSLPLPGYKGLRVGLPARRLLRRRWQQQRPDVVYVATEGLLGLSAVRVARGLGIPVYSGFHTNFHSYLRYYHAGWLEPPILSYLRWFHNQATGTIVACADLSDQLQSIGVKNIHILGRGVDSRRFSPEHRSAELRKNWRAARNELIILYVGRLAAEKNLHLAIDAYRAMQQHSRVARFVLVGDGPQRAALQAQHPDLLVRRRTHQRRFSAPLRLRRYFLVSQRNRDLRQCDLGGDGKRIGRSRLRLCRGASPYTPWRQRSFGTVRQFR